MQHKVTKIEVRHRYMKYRRCKFTESPQVFLLECKFEVFFVILVNSKAHRNPPTSEYSSLYVLLEMMYFDGALNTHRYV